MAQHTAIIGAQRGDEGKGKIVDLLAKEHEVVVRYGGGTNAGHTVVHDGKKFPLHLIPSGILRKESMCVIGDEVVLDPVVLADELTRLDKRVSQRAPLYLSRKAHLIMPWHKIRDGMTGKKLGTTMRGIGPTYTDATGRRGIRVMDWTGKRRFRQRVQEEMAYNRMMISGLAELYEYTEADLKEIGWPEVMEVKQIVATYQQAWETLRAHGVKVVEVGELLTAADEAGKRILYEGAQAVLLDITHGHYPFVTSSHPAISGVYNGGGFRPRDLRVIGVSKAYLTHVGESPFPTKLTGKVGEQLRKAGNEFGTTTGRPRDCGWLDLVALKYAKRINGLDELALTKLDILSGLKKVKVAVAYEVGSKRVDTYSADQVELYTAKPVYEIFEGWKEPIQNARAFSDLPKAAQKYIEMIEKRIQLPIRYIGVGPGREQIINRAF